MYKKKIKNNKIYFILLCIITISLNICLLSHCNHRQDTDLNSFCLLLRTCIFSWVQLLSHVQLFWPNEQQHTRPPCPSPSPGVHPNPCPLSQWCHPAISFSVIPFSSCPPIFPSIRVFTNESALHMRWAKYWSFSFNISPSNEHKELKAKGFF